jgi:hypothetical protein
MRAQYEYSTFVTSWIASSKIGQPMSLSMAARLSSLSFLDPTNLCDGVGGIQVQKVVAASQSNFEALIHQSY